MALRTNAKLARLILLALCVAVAAPAHSQPAEFDATIVRQFDAYDAYQAVAVDADAFYAINNARITRHGKTDGRASQQLGSRSAPGDPLVHLDSGAVLDGKLYAAHSNYPGWPMTSSVEVWDLQTLEHVDTHNFGVMLGSLTWLDRYDDHWWGAFANYDIVQRGMDSPYGKTENTVVVKFDDDFEVVLSWTIPAEILRRMSPMSNSGGSWGPDGRLYLSGHDDPELYVMNPPDGGGELEWLATISIPGLNGQGIAWDRAGEGNFLWAILRSTRQVLKIQMPDLAENLTD